MKWCYRHGGDVKELWTYMYSFRAEVCFFFGVFVALVGTINLVILVLGATKLQPPARISGELQAASLHIVYKYTSYLVLTHHRKGIHERFNTSIDENHPQRGGYQVF